MVKESTTLATRRRRGIQICHLDGFLQKSLLFAGVHTGGGVSGSPISVTKPISERAPLIVSLLVIERFYLDICESEWLGGRRGRGWGAFPKACVPTNGKGECRLFEVARVEIEQLCRDRQTIVERTTVEVNARNDFVCVNEGERTVTTKSVMWRVEEKEGKEND